MYLKNRQKEIDEFKWNQSFMAGEDKCGTYVFCGKCCKEDKYPCARAEYRYKKGHIRLAVVRRHR